jgi:hypothetical protein
VKLSNSLLLQPPRHRSLRSPQLRLKPNRTSLSPINIVGFRDSRISKPHGIKGGLWLTLPEILPTLAGTRQRRREELGQQTTGKRAVTRVRPVITTVCLTWVHLARGRAAAPELTWLMDYKANLTSKIDPKWTRMTRDKLAWEKKEG